MNSPSVLPIYPFILIFIVRVDARCALLNSVQKDPSPEEVWLDVGLVARTLFDKLLSACRHPVCSAPFIH